MDMLTHEFSFQLSEIRLMTAAGEDALMRRAGSLRQSGAAKQKCQKLLLFTICIFATEYLLSMLAKKCVKGK